MILRDYQENILNWLRHDWNSHQTHLIQAPTGAGKTIIAGTIVKGFYDNGKRILFTVPRMALIDQTIKAFQGFGIDDIGVIQADHEMTDYSKRVQVGTVQTLARRGYGDFDCLIVDEAHIANAKLIEYIHGTDAKVIGLTATPFACWLGTVYQNFIKRVTMAQLMDEGYLSQYEFYAPTKPDLKGVKTSTSMQYGTDYAEGEIARIMGTAKIAGDIIETWLEKANGQPTIAFCCNVLHANFLTVEFRKKGINAAVMVGGTPKDERTKIFKQFADGIIQIICSVDVLVEGFDGDVRCVIYAKPTKSEMRWIQSIGRACRTAKGKDKALILDHSGTVIRLGMPHTIEYEELFSDEKQKQQAKENQDKEKPESKEKECPSCNYIKPAGQYECEKCGFKPIYGEDGEVDEDIKLEVIGKKPVITMEEKQDFHNGLAGYYEQKLNEGKNWKRGWVAHKYKEKFGVWPKSIRWNPEEPSPEVTNFIKYLNIKGAKRKESARKGIANIREMLNA